MRARLSFFAGLGSALIAVVFFLPQIIGAQGIDDLVFPIPELGNCHSQEDCSVYCSEDSHLDACIDYGLKHDLFHESEIEVAREILLRGGPGECRSENECKDYCDDINNADECLAFGLEEGLIDPNEVDLIRDVLAGGGPGGCREEAECTAYCEEEANADECFAFAERHGLIAPGESEIVQEIMSGNGPGGCMGKLDCETYCSSGDHVEECVEFGLRHGLISEEEANMAKRFGKNFEGPGGCQGEEACEAYCSETEHTDECLSFAEEYDLMSPEEIARAREHGTKLMNTEGPGGCRGEECRDYCEDEDHMEECTAFALEQGFITEEEYEKIKTGGPGGCQGEEACEAYCSDPANATECGIPEHEEFDESFIEDNKDIYSDHEKDIDLEILEYRDHYEEDEKDNTIYPDDHPAYPDISQEFDEHIIEKMKESGESLEEILQEYESTYPDQHHRDELSESHE